MAQGGSVISKIHGGRFCAAAARSVGPDPIGRKYLGIQVRKPAPAWPQKTAPRKPAPCAVCERPRPNRCGPKPHGDLVAGGGISLAETNLEGQDLICFGFNVRRHRAIREVGDGPDSGGSLVERPSGRLKKTGRTVEGAACARRRRKRASPVRSGSRVDRVGPLRFVGPARGWKPGDRCDHEWPADTAVVEGEGEERRHRRGTKKIRGIQPVRVERDRAGGEGEDADEGEQCFHGRD